MMNTQWLRPVPLALLALLAGAPLPGAGLGSAPASAQTVHRLVAGPETVAFGHYDPAMDLKELVAGTTLFIPVWVEGALFEVGDGHAAQGDGEVNQTGLETSLEGRLQIIVHEDRTLDWPRAETATHHITMGFDPDLEAATEIAIREAVELIREHTSLTQGEAYSVVSMAVDLRITELVDQNVGVHAMIAKDLLDGR